MTAILTAAEMRALEQAAIASGEVTGLELMERAGRGVVEAILAEWPDIEAGAKRAVVLCGPGNNGGDGFVVARLLKERGWEVEAFLYGDPGTLPPDAGTNCKLWRQMGPIRRLSRPKPTESEMQTFRDAASRLADLKRDPAYAGPLPPFLLVDALFGIGQSRPLSGIDDLIWHWDYLTNFRDLTDSRVVAVDVPSGLDSDTGDLAGGAKAHPIGALAADLTVTFHACKPCHGTGPWSRLCGKVVVVDIGLPT